MSKGAWKLAARKRFIGWNEPRIKNLQLVVNNARFLILPWIQSKGLASKNLALAARQLPHDWLRPYGYRPVLLRPSSKHNATAALATRPPTGARLVRPAGAAKNLPATYRSSPSKTSGSTRYARTSPPSQPIARPHGVIECLQPC
jgi:Domain of unknown function (DUF4338)